MRSSPEVSVVMPVFNAARYLAGAVESILAQTFIDFEFICVDDGSTDHSLDILRAYERNDRRMRVISRPNSGIVGALNDGLRMASGRLVARMDADDAALENRFAEQVDYLGRHPECVAVGGQVELIDHHGMVLGLRERPLDHKAIDRMLLTGDGTAICHPTVMMRRAAVEQVGAYRREAQFAEDLDLFLRLGEIGGLANVAQVHLQYRQHLQSICSSKDQRHQRAVRWSVEQAVQRRGLSAAVLEELNVCRFTEAASRERDWARMALGAGNLQIGRRHAWSALRRRPFSVKSWNVMLAAYRGSPLGLIAKMCVAALEKLGANKRKNSVTVEHIMSMGREPGRGHNER